MRLRSTEIINITFQLFSVKVCLCEGNDLKLMADVGGRRAFRVSSTASECNGPFVIRYWLLVLWLLLSDVLGKLLLSNKTACCCSKKFNLLLAVFGFYSDLCEPAAL